MKTKVTRMGFSLLFLIGLLAFSLYGNAQEVAKVTITTKTSIADALEQCKEAGRNIKYGSRDYEDTTTKGKVTLWRGYGSFSPFELHIYVNATFKDGLTTLEFRMPHNKKAIANYTKELKKVTTKLKLPEMMVGEYFDGIE